MLVSKWIWTFICCGFEQLCSDCTQMVFKAVVCIVYKLYFDFKICLVSLTLRAYNLSLE